MKMTLILPKKQMLKIMELLYKKKKKKKKGKKHGNSSEYSDMATLFAKS